MDTVSGIEEAWCLTKMEELERKTSGQAKLFFVGMSEKYVMWRNTEQNKLQPGAPGILLWLGPLSLLRNRKRKHD